MTAITASADRAPRYVKLLGPIATFLLAARVPLGFNGLITIRGRKSGVARTIPLAIIDVGGRRWVWSPWGDVQWVQNLRAAGRATVTVRGRTEEVTAVELDATQRVDFFREVLGPVAHGMRFGKAFVRFLDGVDVDDPVGAADGRRVFELRRAG